MRGLARRLDRLEQGHSTATLVVGYVPRGWPADEREPLFERLAEDAGGVGPFAFLILDDSELRDPKLSFFGDGNSFFDRIARNGRRIHEPDEEYAARMRAK